MLWDLKQCDAPINFGQVHFSNFESRMGANPNMWEESGREIKDENKVMDFDRRRGGDEVDVQLTEGHYTTPNS